VHAVECADCGRHGLRPTDRSDSSSALAMIMVDLLHDDARAATRRLEYWRQRRLAPHLFRVHRDECCRDALLAARGNGHALQHRAPRLRARLMCEWWAAHRARGAGSPFPRGGVFHRTTHRASTTRNGPLRTHATARALALPVSRLRGRARKRTDVVIAPRRRSWTSSSTRRAPSAPRKHFHPRRREDEMVARTRSLVARLT
jgi:hypothetical protein